MTGLPAIADANLPHEIRTGSEADKRAYKAALGFEQVLLGELVGELAKSTPSLTEGARAGAITDAMTASLAAAGGVGLAPQLYSTLRKDTA